MAERRTVLTRRAALGLAGLGVMAACTPGGTDISADARPVATTPRLTTRWDARPDGPLPPTGDEGVPIVPILSNSPTAPTVTGRALVGNLPPASQAAAYVTQRLGRRVDRIGARYAYGPGGPSGSIALLGWTGEATINGHCHMVITPDRWIAGVVTANSVVEIASDRFAAPLPQDGTPLTVDVQFRGTDVTLSLPDGSVKQVSDVRFAAPGGVVAGWEFYKNVPDDADVRFYETWAG